MNDPCVYIVLTKTTAAQNQAALSYDRLRGLYFLAVVFVRSIGTLSLWRVRLKSRDFADGLNVRQMACHG